MKHEIPEHGWLWTVTYNNVLRETKSKRKAFLAAEQAEKWRRFGKPIDFGYHKILQYKPRNPFTIN